MAESQLAVVLDHLKQWKFSSMAKPATLVPKLQFSGPADRNYFLKNSAVRKFLQHEKQRVGINLGWTDDAEPSTAVRVTRWFLPRNSTSTAPVRYGETVALGCGESPSYIRHETRDVGVDLAWTENPAFEWRILGGEIGEPVDPNQYSALYNADIKECLIFFDRDAGADIGWPSSKTFLEQAESMLRDAIKNHLREAYDDLMARD
jgi:hypothetical protein